MKIPSYFLENQSLKANTYYQIGGVVRYLSCPSTFQEVQETLFFCKEHLLPCALLGLGSNTIFSEEYFDGVIVTFHKLTNWYFEDENHLMVEAGLTNTQVSEIACNYLFEDLFWMNCMPGQIGASVRMNARCYGFEMSNVISDVVTLDGEGRFHLLRNQNIFYGYKDTLFMKEPSIVLAVRFHLNKKNSKENILLKMKECENDRNKKYHFLYPSCGSTFKNNYDYGVPSGKIFEELGFRGKKIGDAQVSLYHANFLWNLGNATSTDILSLAADMKLTAKKNKNVDLELEVQPMGIFSEEQFHVCGMENLGLHVNLTNQKFMGLFWHPDFLKNKIDLPQILFHAPFYSYFFKENQGVVPISVEFKQMISLTEAKNSPHKPFLQWTTYCAHEYLDKLFSIQYPASREKFISDKLWEYSVSEIFIAHPSQKNGYLEFEMTPQLSWVAIRFDDLRVRHFQHQFPNFKFWKNIQFVSTDHSFSLLLPYENVFFMMDNQNEILFHGALSLGNQKYYTGLPITKKSFPNTKEDFHDWEHFSKIRLFE